MDATLRRTQDCTAALMATRTSLTGRPARLTLTPRDDEVTTIRSSDQPCQSRGRAFVAGAADTEARRQNGEDDEPYAATTVPGYLQVGK
jgi:hypothetical protein